MKPIISLNSQNRYEIKIYGQLDTSCLCWFGEAEAYTEAWDDDNQVSTFSNVIMDQAGLVGLIRRLHGHGIVLKSIRLVKIWHCLRRDQHHGFYDCL